jgi:hypothetical protein
MKNIYLALSFLVLILLTSCGWEKIESSSIWGSFIPNQDLNCISEFTLVEEELDWVQDYYVQSCTWLKWEITSSTTTYEWATNTAYTEPSWDWTNYDYVSEWRVETDYPAFQYCTDKWPEWRLPTRKEMFSIMTDTKLNNNWNYYTKLEAITSLYYWSSTSYSAFAWIGYFWTGGLNYNTKTDSLKVLCIHD